MSSIWKYRFKVILIVWNTMLKLPEAGYATGAVMKFSGESGIPALNLLHHSTCCPECIKASQSKRYWPDQDNRLVTARKYVNDTVKRAIGSDIAHLCVTTYAMLSQGLVDHFSVHGATLWMISNLDITGSIGCSLIANQASAWDEFIYEIHARVINVRAICDDSVAVTNVAAPWPGSTTHDSPPRQ